MHRIFLEKQLTKLNQSQESNTSHLDPSRLLVNYDREVLSMIRRVRDEFQVYARDPSFYPLYEAEKKNFLIEKCIAAADKMTQISMDEIDKHFQIYWQNRVAFLCDLKISREKKQIRCDWKRLLPIYHDLGEDTSSQEFQDLLLSDNEHETDED
jgi:hypothetical protein